MNDEPGDMARTQLLLDPVVEALTSRLHDPHVSPRPMGAYRTIVEAVTYVSPNEISPKEDKEDVALTRCIDVLLGFHQAYRVATNARIPELTYERLPLLLLRLEKPMKNLRNMEVMGVSVLDHTNTPGVPGPDVDESAFGCINQVALRSRHRDPFQLFSSRRLDARVEAQTNGRFGESIVQTAIAAELFFDAILGLMMWEESLAGSMTVVRAAEVFSTDLTPRLRNQYSKRLGGDWSLAGPNLQGWEQDIATVRNRVVHGGYRADRGEAIRATAALTALEHFVGDRLSAKFAAYHRTAWMFLGGSGFERRGRLPVALRWADGIDEPVQMAVLRWVDEYWAWREQVDALVVRRRRSSKPSSST